MPKHRELPHLIVEDEDGDRRLLHESLTTALPDAAIYETRRAKDAIAALRELTRWGGVWVDLLLADGNGFPVVDEALRHHPGTPVYIVTGAPPPFMKRALERSVTQVIAKPATIEKVVAAFRVAERDRDAALASPPDDASDLGRTEGQRAALSVLRELAPELGLNPRPYRALALHVTGVSRDHVPEHMNVSKYTYEGYRDQIKKAIRRLGYTDIEPFAIGIVLRAATELATRPLPPPDEQLIARAKADGFVEGTVEGLERGTRRTIQRQLEARFGALSVDTKQQLECLSGVELDHCVEAVLTARSVTDVM